MVRGEAGPGQKQDLRPELEGHDDADSGGIVVSKLCEDDPVLGGALHPGADVGDKGATGPESIVNCLERSEGPWKNRAHGRPGDLPP